MRWPFALILAYLMLGLQVGVSRYIAFHGAAPNLALIAVLFIALNMRRNGAMLVSFSVGFVQDLLSGQQLGLYAFSYGLVALTIVAAHRIWNRNHPLTYLVVALLGGSITAIVLLLHSLLRPAAPALGEGKDVLRAMRISAGVELTRLLYTVALAPFILFALQRGRNAFIPEQGRRKR
jgi:rod shape-determining protein MreD